MKVKLPQPTAGQAYTAAFSRVNALAQEFQQKLADHRARQQADPKNWGYVGDLQHYEEQLTSLLGREPKFYSVPDGKGGRVRVTVPE